MRFFFILMLFTGPFTLWAQTNNQPNLSAHTRKFLQLYQKSEGTKIPGYNVQTGAQQQRFVAGMVKVNSAAADEALQLLGVRIGTKAGNIWTVRIPYQKVSEVCRLTTINYVQLDEPLQINLDAARAATKVDSVHGGYNLPMPYTGKNVVMGIIDFGFDYNHPTFFDTAGNIYRVKRVWELDTFGTHPAGFSYGHEWNTENDIKAAGTDNPNQTHGTGVAGIASGSGNGSLSNGLRCRGVAFESDMVFVGVRRDSIEHQWMTSGFSDFLDGINYIFQYAASVSKPAVVNISWGGQAGPHDGSTLFNQACNNISGKGKLIVMSAGNEGGERIHLSKTFTTTDTALKTFITFSDTTYNRTWIDMWGNAGKTWKASISLRNANSIVDATPMQVLDNNLYDYTLISGADTCYVKFINNLSEFNGKPHMTIDVFNKTNDSVVFEVNATDVALHAWNEYYYYGYKYKFSSSFESLNNTGFISGNSNSTASDMGSADSVLLVGAYNSRLKFTDINNRNWQYNGVLGNISSFSSLGPLVDNRTKPDITAPGLTVGTAVTSYDTNYTATGSNSQLTISKYNDPNSNKDFYWSQFAGTSASSPVAAGIAALLLQADPTLTPGRFIELVKQTAIKDNFTGTIPVTGSNTWGYGKINAYSAMRNLLGISNIHSVKGKDLHAWVYPNPAQGTFQCMYTAAKKENISIAVYNQLGQAVYQKNYVAHPGTQTWHIQPSTLSAGLYVVQIKNAEGQLSVKLAVKD